MIFLHHFFHYISEDRKHGTLVLHPVERDKGITRERGHASAFQDFSLSMHMCRHQVVSNETTPNALILLKLEHGIFAHSNSVIGQRCRVGTTGIVRGEDT
jgi:hypothetical protein